MMIYTSGMQDHVSVQNHHQAHPMKAQSDTYEENHREEEASGHKHCKEEKPSYFEGNMGGGGHPTRMSPASSAAKRMRFAPAPPIMNQRMFGGRLSTEGDVLKGESRTLRGDPGGRKPGVCEGVIKSSRS
jgi:hypothetical protein